MVYAAQKQLCPLKDFAYYTYGSIDRDIGDYGSLYDAYIFMSFVDGETSDKAWEISMIPPDPRFSDSS